MNDNDDDQLMIFTNLDDVAIHLRDKLKKKKYMLLFAFNGIGKTRLCMAFKEAGKENAKSDTLYFNAFTEDLFTWDNDLENNIHRRLLMNKNSQFIKDLSELDMENRIRPLLKNYANFDFYIQFDDKHKPDDDKHKPDDDYWPIIFTREIIVGGNAQTIDHIKISRGEENLFIWCFFLAIVQRVIDEESIYDWVKFIYIDDPISSLDDNNAIAVAHHLSKFLKSNKNIKVVISTHHTLFFNVIVNEISNSKDKQCFLNRDRESGDYILKKEKPPFFYHVAMLEKLHKDIGSGKLNNYHFNILRSIMDTTAIFHGFSSFSDCINEVDRPLYGRFLNILSHSDYHIFESKEMVPDNKKYLKDILENFEDNYKFNTKRFK